MAWTPIGNPSLKAKEKAEALYSSSGGTGFISMIGIAKFPNTTENPNILTRATFQELIDFEQDVLNQTYLPMNWRMKRRERPNDDEFSDSEGCKLSYQKITPACKARTQKKKQKLEKLRSTFTDKKFYWKDICSLETIDSDDETDSDGNKRLPLCQRFGNPLSFVYEEDSGTYNLTDFDTNGRLISRIRTGKGDPDLY